MLLALVNIDVHIQTARVNMSDPPEKDPIASQMEHGRLGLYSKRNCTSFIIFYSPLTKKGCQLLRYEFITSANNRL